jgi:predicted GIY-YIG superfamily endonuclease
MSSRPCRHREFPRKCACYYFRPREGSFYKFWVYIMCSSTGTLYVGMTGFVDTHILQHKLVRSMDLPRNTSVIGWCIQKNMTTYTQSTASGS